MQLIYPSFLIGLAAVAIPLIIHLLQLRKPQRLLFTNTAFIREVELVTVKHRSVQQLLILLARMLTITALVLVFCQPFIPAKQGSSLPEVATTNILLDNSFSMQLQGAAQGTLFEEALSEARNLGRSAPAGHRFRLVNKSNELMTPTAYQVQLDKLKLAIQTAFFRLKASGSAPQNGKASLYVFSDFQRSAFGPETLDELKTNGEVVLVPLVSKPASNVYVDSMWLDDAFVRVRTNVGLHVRLRNGGSLAANDCPVKVFLGARQVAAFRVAVAPGQATTSVVQVQVDDKTLALGRVVTEDTPATFDNTYYFALQPASEIQIMEIGPQPATQQLYGNEPLFAYSFSKPQNVDYSALRRVNLVLVREVGVLDAGLRNGLQEVLKRGGNVVIVPPALATGHDSYQRLFRDLGLGVVQWESQAVTPELREVAMPNAQEPFFQDVFGAQQRAATMPRAAPVLRWSRTGADILRLRDGESYLASFASGAGRVYVFSAPFAKAYSDFVAHALFVPVMYRMAMLSYRNQQLPAYRLTQGTVTLQLPVTTSVAKAVDGRIEADEAGFRLVKDSLTLIPAQRALGQEVRLELPESMNAPGFYQVQRRGKTVTTLAFNQDKRESNLAAYSAAELRRMIGKDHPTIRVLEGGGDGASLANLRAEQTGQPLWRYFLAVALGCLLAEALLVRFGRRRAGAAAVNAAA